MLPAAHRLRFDQLARCIWPTDILKALLDKDDDNLCITNRVEGREWMALSL